MYVTVVVTRPTHRYPASGADPIRPDSSRWTAYTYRLPDRLRETTNIGHLVQVPFGHGTALGIVTALSDVLPDDLPPQTEIREVSEILDPLPVVTVPQIALARWIAREYMAPLSQSVRLMLPPGLEERTFVVVNPVSGEAAGDLPPEETELLRYLRRQKRRVYLGSLLKTFPDQDPKAALHALVERGLVDARPQLVPPKPASPRVQYVRLLADEATIESALPRLGRSSKQAEALWALARRADVPPKLSDLCQQVDCTPGPVKALADRGLVEITPRRTLVVALPQADQADLGRAHKQAEVLAAILGYGRPIEQRVLQRETGASTAIIGALEEKKLVQRIVQEPLVLLTLPRDEVLGRVIALRGAETQYLVLELLRETMGRVWVGGIYAQTGADLGTLRSLADRGLISLHEHEYERPLPKVSDSLPTLTLDQTKVWEKVEAGVAAGEQDGLPFVALLHGVTGSGKTEIYLRALQRVLDRGKRAIVLVPEISLTAQTVRRFEARFPGRVAVLHSQLSLGQRYEVWDKVRGGDVDVLIGPRSALFAPVSRLGLIVLDEVHDESYKQTEPIPLPAYHARDTAHALSRLTGATLIMGSATPDLVTYHRARQGVYRLLELPHRIVPDLAEATGVARPPSSGAHRVPASLPPVRVVDLRQELRAGNRSIFSRALQTALRRTLDAGEQAVLFLNRRGSATFVFCRDCGYVARCPRCDIPLTYHHSATKRRTSQQVRLVCHRCNHREPSPSSCPDCGGKRIRYFGLGTERVEETLWEMLPQARLLRWDRDTASGPDHERFLLEFIEHRADILVGTQMIAKGLDLPLVTLVGVVSADTALHLPDYRAAERTFQLLAQVAGRAGRSRRGGQVILQTYSPAHYAIQSAAHHDFSTFAEQELTYRQNLSYPPYCRLVALRYRHQDALHCRAEAQRLGVWLEGEIQRLGLRDELIGPTPCFFSRVEGRYRWQIIIRTSDPAALLGDVALPRGWYVDVDPLSLL